MKPKEARDDDEQMSESLMSETEIDYNLMESFPASDPPSWTLGLSPDKTAHEEFEGEEPSATDPTHQTQTPPEENVCRLNENHLSFEIK